MVFTTCNNLVGDGKPWDSCMVTTKSPKGDQQSSSSFLLNSEKTFTATSTKTIAKESSKQSTASENLGECCAIKKRIICTGEAGNSNASVAFQFDFA